jgi:hypothetical protein
VAFGAVEESHESVRGMLTDMGVSDPPTFFVHALQRTLDADGITGRCVFFTTALQM